MMWNPPRSANKVGQLEKRLPNMKRKRLLRDGEMLCQKQPVWLGMKLSSLKKLLKTFR
uniref:Uncharacterized protein n=1 Tax=Helianthus annuus TaxID=4232 RepID=A0A251V3R9_HELAN